MKKTTIGVLLVATAISYTVGYTVGHSKPVDAMTVTLVVEYADCDTCLIEEADSKPEFELSDYERRVVENIVMGEAEGESWDGKVLVAQCILNACLRDNLQPSDVREKYKYSGWNENPDNETTTAVVAVFDDGHKVTNEPILWFYAPQYVESAWHETQRYVLTEGGHRFFAPWEDSL